MSANTTDKQDTSSTQSGQTPPVRGWKRGLYLVLALLCLILGTIGILLPGLPTTPFLLLTGWFLVRCSPKLNQTLLRSRLFGPILTDWQIHGGVRPDVKIQAIVIVVLAVGATIYFSGMSGWACGSLVFLASVGVAVILKLPTAR